MSVVYKMDEKRGHYIFIHSMFIISTLNSNILYTQFFIFNFYIFSFHILLLLRTWHISVPMTTDDVLKEIKGNQVAFQDCFIADVLFLLTFPLLTMPEIPDSLPITSPQGSQLILAWATCVLSSVVVVADMETFQTNDSFRTWTRIRVPPNILTDDERHNVSDVNISWDGIFFLINGILYIKTFTAFKRLGRNENLPDGGIIGITSRKWCWARHLLKVSKRLYIYMYIRLTHLDKFTISLNSVI